MSLVKNSIVIKLDKVHIEPGKSGKWAIFTKKQGRTGIVVASSIIFIQVRENKLFS